MAYIRVPRSERMIVPTGDMPPSLRDRIMDNLRDIVQTGIYSGARVSKPRGGLWVQRLEEWFTTKYGVKHAVACSSATAGLYMALRAAGVGFGDRILVPANTMTATASAVLLAGATPIFVDARPDNGMTALELLLEAAESCQEEWGHAPNGFIPVHVHGQVQCVSAYRTAFAQAVIVEDCAQALGCRENISHRAAGTIGHAGVFSFKQGKVVTCGEGGMVVTEDDSIYTKLLAIRNHGENGPGDDFGFNFWLTELQAAVAIEELDELASRQRLRFVHSRELARRLGQLQHYSPMEVDNPPFIFYMTTDDPQRPAPKGFTKGYHKPLCCVPFFKKDLRQPCAIGAHVFHSTMSWIKPPESEADVARIEKDVKEADRENRIL